MSQPDTTVRVKLVSVWEEVPDRERRPPDLLEKIVQFTFSDSGWHPAISGAQTLSGVMTDLCSRHLPHWYGLEDIDDTHCHIRVRVTDDGRLRHLVFASELQQVVGAFADILADASGKIWSFIPDDQIMIRGGVTMGKHSSWRVSWLDLASITPDVRPKHTHLVESELQLRGDVVHAQGVPSKIGSQVNLTMIGHELDGVARAEITETVQRNLALTAA